MHSLLRQIGWFIVVGIGAALTHWLTAVGCVELFGLSPLAANVVGWLCAFFVSFCGHFQLTFRHQKQAWHVAVRRFFLISALGFAVNQAAYAWLLEVTAIRYDVLLALVLAAVAGMTFVLSRLWAFAHNDAI
jgi:putative flippase GtrA